MIPSPAVTAKHYAFLNGLAVANGFVVVPSVKVPWGREREKYLFKGQPDRLREVLPCELVIEFDGPNYVNREDSISLVIATAERLVKDNVLFLVFDHGGKSPHIHAFLPFLVGLEGDALVREKRLLMEAYALSDKLDGSLAAKSHLIAAEYSRHWKYNTLKREIFNGLPRAEIPFSSRRCDYCLDAPASFVDMRGVFSCEACVLPSDVGEAIRGALC